jgi:hypothetical protein
MCHCNCLYSKYKNWGPYILLTLVLIKVNEAIASLPNDASKAKLVDTLDVCSCPSDKEAIQEHSDHTATQNSGAQTHIPSLQ